MEKTLPQMMEGYKLTGEIGFGAFSKVYQGFDVVNHNLVALKFVDRRILGSSEVLRTIEREMRISERLRHKNIVSFEKVFFLEKFVVLVMECLSNGTLTDLKNSALFDVDYTIYLRWGKDILEGLQYLHQKHIAHHDIKPDNIGFDTYMNAKIFDIGLCEEFTDYCYCKSGTPIFKAPEILNNDKYDGTKADIWSFGVTFHYLVTGLLPFSSFNQISHKKNRENYTFCIKNCCSEPLKEIVDLALTIDPNMRPSAEQLLRLDIFKSADCCESLKSEKSLNAQCRRQKKQKASIFAPLIRKRNSVPKSLTKISIFKKQF